MKNRDSKIVYSLTMTNKPKIYGLFISIIYSTDYYSDYFVEHSVYLWLPVSWKIKQTTWYLGILGGVSGSLNVVV